MKMYIVYALHCLHDDRVYVGCTQNLESRIHQHQGLLRHGEHYNYELQEAYNADPTAFEVVVLEQDKDRGYACEEEQNWISRFGARAYNIKAARRPLLERKTLESSFDAFPEFNLHEIAEMIRRGDSTEEICERLDLWPCMVEEIRESPYFSCL